MFSKLKFALTLIALVAGFAASAQIGASGSKGAYVDYDMFVSGPMVHAGDCDIEPSGKILIGNGGQFEVNGGLANYGVIVVDSNGVLVVKGDIINNSEITIKHGGKILFYGRRWKNAATAKVTGGHAFDDGRTGGDLYFAGDRPGASLAWLSAAPFLVNYVGEQMQQLDGGSVPMDVAMHISNPLGLYLENSDTRIEGSVSFEAPNCYAFLREHKFIFTPHASLTGYAPDRYFVTDGVGHLVKENFSGQWTFPVGRDTVDYTPAAIDNNVANTFSVAVQDFDNSASVETTPETVEDGVSRTWNIYAGNAAGISTITLQHNSKTNQAQFNSESNYVTRWSMSDKNTTGDKASITAWQNNASGASVVGNLSSTGPVEGSEMRARTYRTFATSPSDATAFFTKATLAFKPKTSADLLALTADSAGCDVNLAFATGRENNVIKFQLQHSVDGKTFTTIYTFEPKGDNSDYDYKHLTALQGINYYRIVMLEPSGEYTVSKVVSTKVNCSDADPVIVLYPNPTVDYINLVGLVGTSKISIMNTLGRTMLQMDSDKEIEKIDVRTLPASTYVVEVYTGKKMKKIAVKFLKF